MKKILKSVLAFTIAALTFTSCDDVPMPFPEPTVNKGETTYEGATGSGTADDPYNVAGVLQYISTLGSEESPDVVYIKGKILSITEQYSAQFGNGTFNITDEGTTYTFTVYRALYLGNKKFTANDQQIAIGDEVVVCGKVINYKNTTPETVQGTAYLYALNGQGGGSVTPGTPSGDGTQANPYNADGVIAFINTLGSDKESSADVYIKGKVAAITEQYGNEFGNATFTISDDGTTATTQFQVYRALYLGNKKYTSGDVLKVGDDVIVCGKVVNFKGNTPETVSGKAYLFSLNGKSEGGGSGSTIQPSGDGTQASPYNVQALINYVGSLAADTDTKKDLYVKGIVTSIPNNGISPASGFNNVTFYISDDAAASNKFYIFRAKGLNGGDVTENMIKVGDEVVVFGSTWVNYKGNTPENKAGEAYIVSIKDGGGSPSGGGSSSGDVLTALVNGNFETWSGGLPTGWKSACSASSATLAQSTDAHGGSYSVNVNGNEGANKRLASQEIKLAAGTYTFSFWAKATTADAAQVRPGHVPVDNGTAGTYKYADYVNLNTSWQQFSYEFTLDAETVVCLVVMNPKKSSYSSGKDVLIDDATLTKK